MSQEHPSPIPFSPHTRSERAWMLVADTALTLALGWLVLSSVMFLVSPSQAKESKPKGWVRDQQSMKGLEIAMKGYQTEYNRFLRLSSDAVMADKVMPSRGDLIRILTGEHLTLNPQQTRFLEARRAKKRKNGLFTDDAGQPHLVDSSGHPFMVIWDADGDGTILNPAFGFRDEPPRMEASVLVFSAGPDGDYGTWKDNMTNWIKPR